MSCPAASLNITWYHWPCNIDIMKNQFYMAARIDKIVISELAATDPRTSSGFIPNWGPTYVLRPYLANP